MQFRVLGPLEVESRGRLVRISAAKERALLGLLLLSANTPVSRDRLIDELWGESPPATARHTLEAYVSRLRRALSDDVDGSLIETQPGGYVVRLDGHDLDAARFESLLDEGRAALGAGDAGAALSALRGALALWRGEVLADTALDGTVVEAGRLEELRLAALELRVDAELAVGHADQVAELKALVAAHPLRERFRSQLMLALYRAGRQADALAEYRAARRVLVDELGIEPGAELQELHAAMLRQDPALDAPVAAGRSPRRRRRQYLYVLAAGAVGAVACVALFVAFDGGPGTLVVEANALGVVDAAGGEAEGTGAIGSGSQRVAVGAGSVWVTNLDADTVSRIDPKSRVVRQTIEVGDGPTGIAYGAGFVWVANNLDGTVAKISPRTNDVVDRIQVGAGPVDLAAGGGSIWVANALEHTITRIDTRNDAARTLPSGGRNPAGVAFGAGSLWVANASSDAVTRIDPRSGAAEATIALGGRPSALAWSHGSLWAISAEAGTAARIDPQRNLVVAAVPVAGSPAGIAAGDDAVWVTSGDARRVVRIDPDRNAVAGELELANHPHGLAVVGRDLYVAVGESGRTHRGGTLRVLADLLPLLDPADGNLPEVFDCLVRCHQHGGPLGPDLAVALPRPADEGTTYRFTLRRGIRFSNGAPLRPTDVAYSITRLFRLQAYAASLLESIVGGAECARSPRRCDLSGGVVADDAAGTVTFHLEQPDADFLERLAFAMIAPAATPFRKLETKPTPGTGPYMVAEYRPDRLLRLVRNPHFRVWMPAVQPDGYPDQIVTRMDRPAKQWLDLVLRGEADVINPADAAQIRRAATQHPERLSTQPLQWTAVLTLNKRMPPFDDVRVRRALNYAIDRRAIAALYLGGGAPTCQWLPPNFPAYRRYCPYTIGGGRDGTWLGPDLAKARALVAASGTKGMRVEYWAPDMPFVQGATDYVVGLLRRLGYRVELKLFETEDYFFNRMTHPSLQVAWGWHWVPDFSTPAGFLTGLLGCGAAPPNLSPAPVCDGRVRADYDRAVALDLSDPAAATAVWTRIDHALTDRAEWVWLYNLERRYFFSERVGNHGAALGHHISPNLGQLWVR